MAGTDERRRKPGGLGNQAAGGVKSGLQGKGLAKRGDDASEKARVNEERLQRLYEITNTRVQSELAAILGIRQSSISDAKRRHTIPSEWYMRLFEKYGANPLYIKYATEPKYILNTTGSHVPPFALPSCSVEELLKELFRRWLPDELAEKAIDALYISPNKFQSEMALLRQLEGLLRRLLPGDLVEELFAFFEENIDKRHADLSD